MARAAACASAAALLAASPAAHAEVDYRSDLDLPHLDVAVGLSAGVAFDEDASRRSTGALGGVDVSLLHGFFGAHLGLRAHPEGGSVRLGAVAEVSWWYLVLLGAGVGVGALAGDGGPRVPRSAVALTFLVGIPFPVARLDDGAAGSLVLVPYGRPGLRFLADGDIAGFHEVGLMLKWSSFGF